MRRNLYVGAVFLTLIVALWVSSNLVEKTATLQGATVMAPRFEVDPLWPQPLPNHWLMGQTIGVSVDAQDHVWVIQDRKSTRLNSSHSQISYAVFCLKK